MLNYLVYSSLFILSPGGTVECGVVCIVLQAQMYADMLLELSKIYTGLQ